jgi:hypothetical protein
LLRCEIILVRVPFKVLSFQTVSDAVGIFKSHVFLLVFGIILTESEGLSHDRHDLLSLIIENLWMMVPRILVLLVSIGTALWVFLIVRQVIVDRNLDVIEDRICL